MPPDRTEQLSSIVAALTGYIDVVRSFHLRETAVLLDMAKLDLQMKIHAISDRELHALCEALEHHNLRKRRRRKACMDRPGRTVRDGHGLGDGAALPPARSKNDILMPRRPRRSHRGVRKMF
jgi:hypothetical protein